MADDQDQANAGVPDEPTPEPVELQDLPLTEAEQVAIDAARARPARKAATVDPKGHATRKRSEAGPAAEKVKRTTPIQFTKESVEELRKVIWPTLSQLQQYFIVVLVFVLIIIAFVGALDLLFGWALLKTLG
ncbi:MAG: preprotein translocase subunit SecE [Propionicimonas sp.]